MMPGVFAPGRTARQLFEAEAQDLGASLFCSSVFEYSRPWSWRSQVYRDCRDDKAIEREQLPGQEYDFRPFTFSRT